AGPAALSAVGSGGANSISPTTISGFVNGVWNGNVTDFSLDNDVALIASDGSGHTGVSNAFDVDMAFQQLAASREKGFAMGIAGDRSLWAWGLNANGQLGDGTTSSVPRRLPQQVGSSTGWRRISIGAAH